MTWLSQKYKLLNDWNLISVMQLMCNECRCKGMKASWTGAAESSHILQQYSRFPMFTLNQQQWLRLNNLSRFVQHLQSCASLICHLVIICIETPESMFKFFYEWLPVRGQFFCFGHLWGSRRCPVCSAGGVARQTAWCLHTGTDAARNTKT